MKAMIWLNPLSNSVKKSYDIWTSQGKIYRVDTYGKEVKIQYIGKSNQYKGSGKLLKDIPNHIKKTFFNLQQSE